MRRCSKQFAPLDTFAKRRAERNDEVESRAQELRILEGQFDAALSGLWMAYQPIVTTASGTPRTPKAPRCHSRSSGATSSMWAAMSRACSRTLRVTSTAAAPETGVDREP